MMIKSFLSKIRAEDGLSKNTIDSYGRDLKLFDQFLRDNNRKLDQVNKNDIKEYVAQLYKNNIKSSSLSRKISSLRNFYDFLNKEGIVVNNPLENFENPKKSQTLPKFLSEEEMFAILDYAQKDRSEFGIKLSCILEILYGSGLRVSELVSLPISAIQYDQNNQIKNYLIVKGKGSKERIAPLSKSAINKIEEYIDLREKIGLKRSKWLFSGDVRMSKNDIIYKKRAFLLQNDKHITRQRINQMLKELAIKTNVNPEKVYPHALRHSFATHLLNNGINIRYLQELLGHATISTTEVYTHMLDKNLHILLKKYHPLNEIKEL